MKKVIGGLLVVGGVVFGVWAGLWWALVGGIVQIVEAIQVDPVNALDIALGAVRVLFAGAIGGMSGVALVAPGLAMIR